MPQENIQYPELTPDLKGGFSLKMLKYFGAGAIIASVTIGSGETFFASKGGALFGYALLWCFVGGAIMKGVQVYTSARYMTLTGEHPMAHWKYLPGPRGWFPIMLTFISLLCFPFWLAGLPLFIGKTLNWIVGMPDDHEHYLLYGRAWGTACIAIAVTLTWLQSYGVLEKAQTFIVGFLLASMLAACFAAKPEWLQAFAGLMPSIPEYESWVPEKYPDEAQRANWVIVGTYLGAIGGGTYDYIGYIGCFREKKWGLINQVNPNNEKHETETIATSAKTLPIDESDENVKRGRAWLWPAKMDVGIAFLCVLIFTICFVLLGARILHPQELVPSGNELLNHQSKFLTDQWGVAWKFVYQIGIFMAFFGTIYGAYEIYLRTAYECLMPLSKKVRAMPIKRFRSWVLIYCAGGGLTLLWTMAKPEDIVKPAAIVGGVFACGLWCFAMVWIDRKFLPKKLRMGPILITLNLISGIVLTVLGTQAIVHYVRGIFNT
jgi:Mn2+/Fe2+ NRAMP family transporter